LEDLAGSEAVVKTHTFDFLASFATMFMSHPKKPRLSRVLVAVPVEIASLRLQLVTAGTDTDTDLSSESDLFSHLSLACLLRDCHLLLGGFDRARTREFYRGHQD